MWANKKNNTGFTIVETLIVLAVSAMLFISVAGLIQGQLGKNRARDAAFRVQATVQSVINDVGNGYYPLDGHVYNCAGVQGAIGDNRGTNTGCVLAGKRITFDTSTITIETLVVPVGTTAIGSDPSIFTVVGPLTTTKQLPWSGKLTGTPKVYYVLNSVFSPTTTASTFVTGAQKVVMYASSSIASPFSTPTAANNTVCIDNGVYHARLAFPINGNVAVDLGIDDRTACP